MSQKSLKLLFPQWQGSGENDGLYRGAFHIRDRFFQGEEFAQISVQPHSELVVENGILGYRPILNQLKAAVQLLKETSPLKVFSIGGDCGIELAPVSYLNQIYENDLAVLWFDAHGDLNHPGVSKSKHFHGMPLHYLIGEAESEIQRHCFSKVDPSRIILAGTRDLDPYEASYIKEKRISVVTANEMTQKKNAVIEQIKARNLKHVYLHLDLDVLDPARFPHVMCPSPGGIEPELLKSILTSIKEHYEIAGFSIVEFLPADLQETDLLIDFIRFGCNLI